MTDATDCSAVLFSGRVGVVVKALNEEQHIERCLISALAAIGSLGGVVVLADSGSTDRTIEIAKCLDVRVVQLANVDERCCGIGAQLGFQFVDVDFVYILDGDMELDKDFIATAVALLDEDSSLAGVAGVVEELGGGNYEFESRKAEGDGRQLGYQKCLDMGGLYKVSAVRTVGFLTNRNLHSYEEKELGLRLIAKGYRLLRIDSPSVKHYGKTANSMELLRARWLSRHLDGPGEWTRAAFGTSSGWCVLSLFKNLWLIIGSWVLICFGLAFVQVSCWLLFGVLLQFVLFVKMVVKRKCVRAGFMGYLHLHIYAAAMVRGLFRKQADPHALISSSVIK